jgi:hypothetical protein
MPALYEASRPREYGSEAQKSKEQKWAKSGPNTEKQRKRKRKNTSQLKILKAEYEKGSEWSKEKITRVSKITGLSESQVYKWCWDQKKKQTELSGKVDKIQASTLIVEGLPLYKNENKFMEDLELKKETSLGKRVPFGKVNDSRVDKCVKMLKE